MSATISAERLQRTNQRSLDGGRPARPKILTLEGHVEEIVILKDAAERERRAAETINHLVWHCADAFRLGDADRHHRALTALHRLGKHLNRAATHIAEVNVPEVVACYSALENVA